MIALLTGQMAYKSPDHLIVDVGGVGYRVVIPLSTYYSLPERGEVRLHIHTQVKEDAIQLFGFKTTDEKDLFGLLLSVSGVGPKLAVGILSNIPAEELVEALAGGDSKRLSAVPGIGKKSAERLVLELQEKVGKLSLPQTADRPSPPAQTASRLQDDALSALVNLGYKEKQAQKALDGLEPGSATTVEDLLKGALKTLMK